MNMHARNENKATEQSQSRCDQAAETRKLLQSAMDSLSAEGVDQSDVVITLLHQLQAVVLQQAPSIETAARLIETNLQSSRQLFNQRHGDFAGLKIPAIAQELRLLGKMKRSLCDRSDAMAGNTVPKGPKKEAPPVTETSEPKPPPTGQFRPNSPANKPEPPLIKPVQRTEPATGRQGEGAKPAEAAKSSGVPGKKSWSRRVISMAAVALIVIIAFSGSILLSVASTKLVAVQSITDVMQKLLTGSGAVVASDAFGENLVLRYRHNKIESCWVSPAGPVAEGAANTP